MFLIPSDFERETASLEEHARRHALTVVLANFGGPSGGLRSAGRSAIWSERGERIAGLGGGGMGLVVASESARGWRGRAFVLDDA
jgi:predicted amidohydrolase